MKSTRLLLIVAALITAGCATSLGPSDNFNDWTNSVSNHHYQEHRSNVPAIASRADAASETAGQ
jgi:hypothetical protein